MVDLSEKLLSWVSLASLPFAEAISSASSSHTMNFPHRSPSRRHFLHFDSILPFPSITSPFLLLMKRYGLPDLTPQVLKGMCGFNAQLISAKRWREPPFSITSREMTGKQTNFKSFWTFWRVLVVAVQRIQYKCCGGVGAGKKWSFGGSGHG